MTITRAKGESNDHCYHIEVIDLPFYRITFVSCSISLIENMGKQNFIEKMSKKCVVQCLLGSLFLALRWPTCDAQPCVQPRAVRTK